MQGGGVVGPSSSLLPTLLEPLLPGTLPEALWASAGSPGRIRTETLTWLVKIMIEKFPFFPSTSVFLVVFFSLEEFTTLISESKRGCKQPFLMVQWENNSNWSENLPKGKNGTFWEMHLFEKIHSCVSALTMMLQPTASSCCLPQRLEIGGKSKCKNIHQFWRSLHSAKQGSHDWQQQSSLHWSSQHCI